ncbi:MAG: TatD family hydrolase [Gammaproteobacteria bacterium]|nr:TatD family hydrolase [Gammaproteobacteria bacterium]
MLVDSHCHLNYLGDPDARLGAARAAGVRAFLCVGVGEDTIHEVLQVADRHDDVWASIGQHPQEAESPPHWIEAHLSHPRVVAVGETGLDYHYGTDQRTRELQRQHFEYHLTMAAAVDLPVIVHTRDASAHTRESLERHAGVTGVLHCFTESWELASVALDLGYYISISGIVTFNNGANVRDVVRRVPRERLLVETDSPWLAPVPHRGRTNEPLFVTDTARYLAEFLDWPYEQLAEQTTANFYRLFSRASADLE